MMRRNHYIEAQEADRATTRKPWDESEFSKALAVREKALLRQDRLSTILLIICAGLILGAGVFLALGLKAVGTVFLISGFGALVILFAAVVWQSFSAWRHLSKFEAALFQPLLDQEAAGQKDGKRASDEQL